jgi:hypothetical protein
VRIEVTKLAWHEPVHVDDGRHEVSKSKGCFGGSVGAGARTLEFAEGDFAAEGEAVVVSEEGMEAVLFAPKSLVRHPTAAAVDGAGRLMVVENQAQGRPQSWKGPEQDQVVVLVDENGDDVADRREVFFAGSAFTNDIAQGSEGWVYLVTRNEILRVRDADGDGRAEQVERRLILKTEMAEGESAAVIGPTRHPASRVASSYRCNRSELESLVEPSTTPSSSLSSPVSRLIWNRFERRRSFGLIRIAAKE